MFFKKSKRLQFRRKSLTSTRYPHVSHFRKFEKIGEIPGTDGKSREFRNREGEGGGGVCKPGRSFASHWHLSYPANLEHVFPCVGWLHANARRMVIVHSYPPPPHLSIRGHFSPAIGRALLRFERFERIEISTLRPLYRELLLSNI